MTLTDRIAAILDRHYGGWIDPNTDKSRCPCGHRPSLGESHSSHVAAAIIDGLGLVYADADDDYSDLPHRTW